ncbi:hypothetical protein FRC04_000771 [Tulasnella sp. 424]|nr:hypothetical protein FRC04_000771 [Tulasnella sp. 424]
MSAGETVVKLGVKITYNLNDSPQLRLARHQPTDVTVYDDPDGTSSTTPIGAAKKKSYVGKFAELPLKACLSALKDASPELLSNPSHDYSVYLNDPTEPSSDGSTSGVLVGKGLFTWGLEPQGEEEQTTVFGKVVKDGIRGQSVLVHLTARVSRASSSRPAPQAAETARTTASAPVSSVPVTGNQNANVAALLQLLSSAGGVPALPQMPGNGADMSQLFSALAGVYNFGLSNQPATAQPQPQHPTSNPASRPLPKERVSLQTEDVVIVKEEEEEIQEIECMPSTSTAPPVRPTPIAATRPTSTTHAVKPPAAPASLPKPSTQLAQPPQLPSTLGAAGARPRKSSGQAAAQPLGDKENLPPASSLPTSSSSNFLKPPSEPTPLSKSKSAPSLPFRGTGAVSTQNLTPFLPVPALQPKNIPQPAHPVVLFVQPIPSTLQRPEVAPAVRSSSSGSASKKKGRDTHLHVGPHGNGWYRRADLPPVPSSDAAVIATSTAVNSDAPMSDVADEVEKKDKKKRASEVGDDGGVRKKRKKNKVLGPATSPVRNSGARTIPMAATSPVRKSTTTIKRITLKTSSKPSRSTETPPQTSEATPTTLPAKEMSAPAARQPAPIRQLNFLSLGQRPFLRTQSEGFGQLYPNNLLPPRPIATSLASSPAVPGLALPSFSMPSMVPAASPTPEPSRPSTPAPAVEAPPVPRPCTPPNAAKVPLPPSTPKRRKKSKSPEPKEQKQAMDVDDDEGDGSPLFLPTPQVNTTGSRKGTVGRELARMMAPPMTPTRPKASRQPPKALIGPSSDATDDAVDAALNSAFDSSSDDEENVIVPPPSDLYASITVQKAPLDYKALGLPPSSPPSSFADSSSPNVSPRFTLDAMEDEEMVELMGDPEAAMEEEDASSPKEESGSSGSSSSDQDTERESSVAESASSSSSGTESSSSSDAVIATSDAPPPLQPQMDFATLANMLGLVNTANNCNADSQSSTTTVQPVDGPFDFWNALGITPDAPVAPATANVPSSDGLGGMHGSDIFDFDAATAEGLLNVLGGSGISPKKNVGKDAAVTTPPSLEEESFRSLIENL